MGHDIYTHENVKHNNLFIYKKFDKNDSLNDQKERKLLDMFNLIIFAAYLNMPPPLGFALVG